MHLPNAADETYGMVVVKPGYRKADTLYCSKCSFQVLTICGLSAVQKSNHQAINYEQLVSWGRLTDKKQHWLYSKVALCADMQHFAATEYKIR